MVATAGTGLLVAWLGPQAFVPTLLGVSLLRAGLSLQLPRFRAPERAAVLAAPKGAARLREVMQAWFILPLIAFALVQATHSIIVAFVALIWKQQGLPDGADRRADRHQHRGRGG